jgi:hypothetical protein
MRASRQFIITVLRLLFQKGSERLHGEAFEPEQPAAPLRQHRQSLRWQLQSVIYAYGHRAEGPFYATAQTLNVSERGALLLLDVPLKEGDDLLLINEALEHPQPSRVVHCWACNSCFFRIGVEFTEQNSEFWENLLPRKS